MSEAPTTVATICQTLSARITAGEFAVDGKLPSERALSEQFATTRITLQEALGQLEAQGVIYRQVRRGWFISPPRLIYNPLQRSHFHAMAQQQGRAAHTEAIDSAVVTLDAPLAGRLARYGIHYGRVRFDMLPTLLPQQAAAMLKLTYGSPALFITRVNSDQHDRVIDCDLEYWRYDALHIDVEAL